VIRVNVQRVGKNHWTAQVPLLSAREALGTTAMKAVIHVEEIAMHEVIGAMETARARAKTLDENDGALVSKRKISVREQILEYVAARGADGVTADEVLEALGLSHQTGSARFADLVVTGVFAPFIPSSSVEDAASAATRRTRTKRRAQLFYITPIVEVQRKAFVQLLGVTPDEWLAAHRIRVKATEETRHAARKLAGHGAKVIRAARRGKR
jgi:hypothetical protein